MINKLVNTVSSAKALVIFAHGAGADMEHEYLTTVTQMLNQQQCNVIRFNFPYMDKRKIDGKRRPPDRMPALIDCFKTFIVGHKSTLPVFLLGKSMGGRVAASLANDLDFMQQYNIKGIMCIGYPFHPQNKPENLRLEPLQLTKLPILILQGERDKLGSKNEIAHYTLSTKCQFEYFADGDHDLKPRVKSGFTLVQHQQHAVEQMSRFIHEQR